jgi:uncharacterized protein (TIRG00374 family)
MEIAMVGDATYPKPAVARRSRWRLALGLAMSLVAVGLAYLNRQWLIEAVGLVRSASPIWLAAGLVLVLASYFVSSQVLRVILRSLGHRLGAGRLWAITLIAIVTSQSLPAGGVGSYAFLLHSFRRRGVPAGQAALVATLEAFSYAGAMVLFASFGLAYLAGHALALDTAGPPMAAPLLAGLAALVLIGGGAILLTRPAETLTGWLLGVSWLLGRVLRRPRNDTWVYNTVAEVTGARELIGSRKRLLALLMLVQLTALSGHSLGLLLILHSLGASVGAGVVFAAFGIALLTSTFNVLPGGGGTVETVLVITLAGLGAGAAAVPAVILFRLLNFWAMLPLAGACYLWLSRDR